MVMDEQISRFMDGELDGAEAEAALRGLKRPDGVAAWACYHIIGDALRGSGRPTPGFSRRFAARLEAEPTVLAPRPREVHRMPLAWAVAATVAAVMVVGWVALSTLDPQATVLSRAREATVVRAAQPRSPTVSADYLLAHEEYAPTVQIQGVGPYLRPVSGGTPDGRP